MRIQHNILALNAYRNYQNNTNALGKNLEKLSSGYRINRAGDDAAGLAISEKMRAQITGLDAAQKNVKDGISLVKTAEGAMQEIHDMLNRMDYLATQSANGTYQNEVDRENLQKEVNSLRTEINRIADSSNFNGIKLLDGSMGGVNEAAFNVSAVEAQDVGSVAVFSDPPAAGTNKGTDTILHTDATEGVAGSFTLDFSQIIKKAANTGANTGVKVTVGSIAQASIALANNNTDLTGKDIAQKLIASGGALDGGIVIKNDGTMVKAQGHTAAAGDVLYTTTSTGADGTLTYTATKICESAANGFVNIAADGSNLSAIPDAAKNAHKLNFNVSVADDTTAGTGALTGAENVAATNITATVKAEAGQLANFVMEVDVTKLSDGMELTVGDKTVTVALGKNSAVNTGGGGNYLDLTDMEAADLTTNKTDVIDRMTAALSGNGYFTVGQNSSNKLTFSEIANGTSGASTLDATHQAELTSVDKIKALFSASTPASNAGTKIEIDSTKINEGDKITVGDKTFIFTTGGTAPAGTTTPDDTYYVDIADPVNKLKDALVGQSFDATVNGNSVIVRAGATATNKDAPQVVNGLTLQIGDTSDNFNQLNVKIGDMHATAMGKGKITLDGKKIDVKKTIADIDISTQKGAQDAIGVIKNAINYVSSVRGDLGAVQNRLEHTANNLSVMSENIQDAESTIRDTDVAAEMMAYTKNNILVQSAQAMLAQANAVPQGVLQLLQ